jgi:hypothetical protein
MFGIDFGNKTSSTSPERSKSNNGRIYSASKSLRSLSTYHRYYQFLDPTLFPELKSDWTDAKK